ncbi:FadR family transcriptional regulator [Amycolatopsis acidicola]|uniref:FadR family transcriptional regulator n=1 Tax=Amycolatopsis acidicola TaxID=2596893 RepID=A0A5N0VBB1_9PSEU|nr:FCD domain-containing protein [Amycolatopsis acidicola]KAA9163669.1 FadR family transcriptional regulator [Amycolatopsis acidicola]
MLDEAAPGKTATQIARRIEEEILARGWPVGELLWSEPELRARSGVSRTVLREAVRLVEHHQVARMRRGPQGGLLVTAPDTGPSIWAMAAYLEFTGVRVADILRVRSLLEPMAAALAAERITEDGILALRKAFDRERPGYAGPMPEERLHARLSELSGNPVLELFVDALDSLTRRYVHLAGRTENLEIGRTSREAHLRHGRILDSVIAGRAAEAEIGVRDHLDGITAWLGRRGALGRPALGLSSTAEHLGSASLAVSVAARMYDDITGAGWPVGTSLGSEAELTDRYQVSRAVLRAAVRLLEQHAIASPRRGRIGGLVVTAPSRQASVDSAALYLAYKGMTTEHARVVREALELGAVRDVVAGGDMPGEPFHTGLAEASGNSVLCLFLGIVGDVMGEADPEEHTAAHHEVTEALRANDTGLALHRLRRHLNSAPRCWS